MRKLQETSKTKFEEEIYLNICFVNYTQWAGWCKREQSWSNWI